MGTVSLSAVAIDELRDAFSGTDAAVARLRSLALATWPPPPRPGPPGNLLDKLGPFSRRAVGAPVVRPGVPTGRDVDDVAHGRDVAPDRLEAAWALVDLWLADAAWGRLAVEIDDRSLDALDFGLAFAGVPARFALRPAFNGETGIPVKPLPGMATGYVRGGHAAAMASAWAVALPGVDADHRELAARVATWLARFPDWEEQATRCGRPGPDLVVVYRP